MKKRVVIGIRDSGVGGLTVARRVRETIPGADLLVFADTAHVPYGEKTPAQICHYALSISEFLIQQGAQIVVFACNTTSAIALEAARARFNVPIFGVIEPGARVASHISRGKVGVLATAATVSSGVYEREIRACRPDLKVLEIACPALVPLVETHQTASKAAFEACQIYLAPLLEWGADSVVLGCTHYPLLTPMLKNIAPHIDFIDPAQALAQQVAAHVGPVEIRETKDVFYISGPRAGFSEWATQLLKIQAPRLENGPVFDL
jgi:glutamate racemase